MEMLNERNQCLTVHLAAGDIQVDTSQGITTDVPTVMKRSRKLRLELYNMASRCNKEIGQLLENEPLMIAELRAHAHDALLPNHDRDHRSLICSPPELLTGKDVCVIRVSPSCRFTVHVIRNPGPVRPWICLLAYNEHMRLLAPESTSDINDLVASPQSVANPVGWKALLELGPRDVTIATRCLSRCPHCQAPGVRLPLGIEGAIVGKSTLLTDVELMSFSVERPWTREEAELTGNDALRAWEFENATPALDEPGNLASEQMQFLECYVGSIPSEDTEYSREAWGDITARGDQFVTSVKCVYKAAHAYISHWRQERSPHDAETRGFRSIQRKGTSRIMGICPMPGQIRGQTHVTVSGCAFHTITIFQRIRQPGPHVCGHVGGPCERTHNAL